MIDALALRVRALRFWPRRLAAFVAGLLAALAMPPFFAWPVLFLSLPCLVWLLDGIAAEPRSAAAQSRLGPRRRMDLRLRLFPRVPLLDRRRLSRRGGGLRLDDAAGRRRPARRHGALLGCGRFARIAGVAVGYPRRPHPRRSRLDRRMAARSSLHRLSMECARLRRRRRFRSRSARRSLRHLGRDVLHRALDGSARLSLRSPSGVRAPPAWRR